MTAILNGSGDPMVTYTYDAWGNILEIGGEDANTLGRTNPLRYRGYVYDQETGLYYLQSRYYDPEMGRFISADAYYSTGQGFVGNNMFAYCLNNPINMHDPDGTCSRFLFWEIDCGKATCKSSKNYNPLATRVAVIYDARTSGSFFGLFGGEGFKFQAEETIEDLESSHRVEALPFTTVGGFVDSWNSLAGEYEEVYIFSHGYPGGLSCAGESISRSGDEYSFGSLHFAEAATVYLYSCNGATHSPNGSVAYQLAQITGGSVWAIADG